MSDSPLRWVDTWEDVRDQDIAKVAKLLRAGGLSIVDGSILDTFEERFASFAGCDYGVAFNNGTMAIHCALRAVGVGPGDEVLVGNYGFHAMAAAVVTLGARVVVCDCDPEALTISPVDIDCYRTERTKAVLVHNPWGLPADYRAIRESARGLPIIADASHAHGARYEGKPLGAWVDLSAYSLGLNKLISGGELGCVVTDDIRYRDRLLVSGHVNRVPGALKTDEWSHNAIGLKGRPHPVALMLALGQLDRFEQKRLSIRDTAQRIEGLLSSVGATPLRSPWRSERVWWRIVAHAATATQTEALSRVLAEAGIPLEKNHYDPLLQDQPIFSWPDYQGLLQRHATPVCEDLRSRLLTVPVLVSPPTGLLDQIETNLGR